MPNSAKRRIDYWRKHATRQARSHYTRRKWKGLYRFCAASAGLTVSEWRRIVLRPDAEGGNAG